MWREIQNDRQQIGVEHHWKEFCMEKGDLQRQVFKGARICHTSRKSRNAERAEEAAFIQNERAGNKTYSKDTEKEVGLERKMCLHNFPEGEESS